MVQSLLHVDGLDAASVNATRLLNNSGRIGSRWVDLSSFPDQP